MRYLVVGLLSMLAGGVVVASCFDGAHDCALNAAVDCSGQGGCSAASDCVDNQDPCTRPVCNNGECGTEPDNEDQPCGNVAAGGAGGASELRCENGECIGCTDRSQCLPDTECRSWECTNKKCVPTNGETALFHDPVGDCKNATCAGGALIFTTNTADAPVGGPEPCKVWGCVGSTPLVGAPVDAGTECMPSICGVGADGVHQEQTTAVCNSAGACTTGIKMSCGDLQCDSVTKKCKPECMSKGDCVTGYYCDGNHACQLLLVNGSLCGQDGTICKSGFCADGVCCNEACDGLCESCNQANTAGTCTPLPAGKAESGDCSMSNQACNGAGQCAFVDGQTCAIDPECVKGNCVDGVCCDTACTGTCVSCNVTDKEGTCAAIPAGTDPDDECLGGSPFGVAVCNGAGACRSPDGTPCAGDGACLNGHCTDKFASVGVCCATACTGGCKTCQSNGTCSTVSNGAKCNKNDNTAGTCTNGTCN
ncbi:MAG: hypothetical protein U0441_12180 [Polyangiaceae bacterium]